MSGDNLCIETQKRIEYTKQKLMRIEQINEQVQKIKRSNKTSVEKLRSLMKRRQSLESDVKRLADFTVNTDFVDSDIINAIDTPLEYDVICAEQFRKKMCQLKVLLNEIIVRTAFNEKAMCTEIGHQEQEFEVRLLDAIQTRKMMMLKNLETQRKCDELKVEHAMLYEKNQKLGEELIKFDASRWLLNVERRRVSDLLDKMKREPKIGKMFGPKQPKKDANIIPVMDTGSMDYIRKRLNSASLSHHHPGSKFNSSMTLFGKPIKPVEVIETTHEISECHLKSDHDLSLMNTSENDSMQMAGFDIMKIITDAIEEELKNMQ